MRTFFLLLLVTTVMVFQACKDEESLPVYEVADVFVPNLANNDTDFLRLCIAELLAQMLLEEDFREYVQQQSINSEEDWNNELLLIQLLDARITPDFTFLDYVDQAIGEQGSSCFTGVANFRSVVFNDPLLVLKLPDGIPAEEWDVSRTVPFVYAKTLNAIQYSTSTEDKTGTIGVHASGAVDVYQFDQPNYFPLVLKYSEDFVAVDEDLTLDSGTRLIDLHSNIPASAYSSAFFASLEKISGTPFHLVRFNDLMDHIYAQRAELFEPNPSIPCSEECSNDCIQQADRRLLATGFGIDTRNELTLENDFTSYYRLAGQFLLSESMVPLILGRQVSSENFYDWERYLFGSYRLTDLFDATFTHTVSYENFSVNGENAELPAFSSTAVVNGLKELPLPNIVIAGNIAEGDLFRYASYQIKLDVITQTLLGVDDNDIPSYGIRNGVVLNYNLFCDRPEAIGLNSIALFTTY
ncbi:MAG: hypothetical protein AAFP77_11970 [Bacteroidota bacterium]